MKPSRAILLSFLLLLSGPAVKAASPTEFALGADLSLAKYIQDHHVVYRDAGAGGDPLVILKNHGCNFVRLRLMVDPDGRDGQVNTLPYTLVLAREVKKAGLHLLLDFFYSDRWADPGHQWMPGAWKELSHPELVDRVFHYTKDTLDHFRAAGCLPDMIEVGNEITNGMIWNDGGPLTEAKWDHLAELIEAGVRGARAADPAGSIQIMIHIDRGGNGGVSHWFFDHLEKRKVPYDVIGLSYYPEQGGSLSALQANMTSLAETYHRDVIVAETSFPWRNWKGKKLEFPANPEGQQRYLRAVLGVVASIPEGLGKGVFYWGAEWIKGAEWSGPAWSGDWERRALFDDSGNVLPAVDAYREFRSTLR